MQHGYTAFEFDLHASAARVFESDASQPSGGFIVMSESGAACKNEGGNRAGDKSLTLEFHGTSLLCTVDHRRIPLLRRKYFISKLTPIRAARVYRAAAGILLGLRQHHSLLPSEPL
jgi:hypothetical protein